jgi:hypothetical protein
VKGKGREGDGGMKADQDERENPDVSRWLGFSIACFADFAAGAAVAVCCAACHKHDNSLFVVVSGRGLGDGPGGYCGRRDSRDMGELESERAASWVGSRVLRRWCSGADVPGEEAVFVEHVQGDWVEAAGGVMFSSSSMHTIWSAKVSVSVVFVQAGREGLLDRCKIC